MKQRSYKSFVFDCDGVILNSNKVKTDAFYKVALKFGEKSAKALVDYHINNGGVSRYKKFSFFLTDILKENFNESTLENLLKAFSLEVKHGLLNCEIASGLDQLKNATLYSKWHIVSGGDQEELREVFLERNLNIFFDGGIYGSPDTKEFILQREIKNNNICLPALFLGDSKYDYKVSKETGLDFLFISGWSEVSNWEDFCKTNNLEFVDNLVDIISLFS